MYIYNYSLLYALVATYVCMDVCMCVSLNICIHCKNESIDFIETTYGRVDHLW